VEQSGAQVIEQLQQLSESGGVNGRTWGRGVDAGVLGAAFHSFERAFARAWEAFGGAPKFPAAKRAQFFCCAITPARMQTPWAGEDDALEMVLVTLREMAKGGMNDQLGGGFQPLFRGRALVRAAIFEKMLYDQAQLAIFLSGGVPKSRATRCTPDVARSVFDYVLRDLAHPEGRILFRRGRR